MEVEKQIRGIIEFYCGGTYENRNTATKEILQIFQKLQLKQSNVMHSNCIDESPETRINVNKFDENDYYDGKFLK